MDNVSKFKPGVIENGGVATANAHSIDFVQEKEML